MGGFTMNETGFGVTDYVVFTILCLASCSGGLWYSATGSKKETVRDVREYLLGGRTMSTWPVALSLIASYVSGVTILGTPAEIYNYGLMYFLICIAISLCCVIVATVYVPVFLHLGISSSYEYLEVRFNRHVRATASILFLVDEVLYLPMVVYVPALAFNQLTGFNVFAVASAMVLICGFYTVLGGLRAVVWTDSFQTIVMYVGVICIAIAGTVSVGGVGTILDVTSKSGRLSLNNWNMSPYERQTGWGVIFGGAIYWVCFNSVNQTMVQRYISLATYKKSLWAISLFCLGAMFAIFLCTWAGLAAWTSWIQGGCSKTGTPLVDDRLLPAFVTYITNAQRLPGLAGVFLAGVFGAGLSSLSAVLNAAALVVIEDIIRGWMRKELQPFTEGMMARIVSAVLAVVSVLMLFVVRLLGGVLGVATALSAIAASTTCGIFTLGMVCWWVGPKGAVTGAFAGALVAGTISMGTQVAAAEGLRAPPLPFTAHCPANVTVKISNHVDPSEFFPLFRISYHWIAPLGFLATLTVGAIAGWLLDRKYPAKEDVELYTPAVWRWVPKEYHDNGGSIRRMIMQREECRSLRLSTSIAEALIKKKANNNQEDTNAGSTRTALQINENEHGLSGVPNSE